MPYQSKNQSKNQNRSIDEKKKEGKYTNTLAKTQVTAIFLKVIP